MRKKSHVVILLVLAGFCFIATANAELVITEIMSESANGGEIDGDWWELTNTGPSSVNLTGYSWDDESHQIPGAVIFGNIIIEAGESIIIIDVPADVAEELWKPVWSLGAEVNVYNRESHFTGIPHGLGSSDGVFLYDTGNVLVTSVTYPSRTTGFSNEWAIDGTFLGLSVSGENGAYQAMSDVASPGHAVQSEPCSSSGKMLYWTDKDLSKIQRLNLDSGCLEDILTVSDGLVNPRGFAIDTSSNKMYWSDGALGEIHRANLDGSGNKILLAGLSYPTDLALDTENSKIYFSETGQARIRKVNLDGTGPIENVITGTGVPYYLTLDLPNSRIYWADVNNTVIRRANLDGTGIEVFISGLTYVRDVVLDVPGNKIYWCDRYDSIVQRANLNDGSGIEILYGPTGLDRPHGLLLDDTDDTLYWTDTDTTAVYRGNKEGTAPMEILASGLDGPWALAIVMVREIKYVDTDATGDNDGTSWEDAFNHLQDALSAAGSGDEIWVAQGIYEPDEDTDNPTGTGERVATFQLKNGVAVKGGYAGFGEPYPDAWDVELYETILSGDLSGNDGADFVNNDENSYHIVNGAGTNSTAVLDGFIITGGNANGSFINAAGAGMYMNDYSSPTVLNCTFRGNSAINGGGMFIEEGGTSIIKNCIFIRNSAGNYGGGLYGEDECDYTLVNCIFTNNRADYGSGIYNFGGDMSRQSLTNCTFYNNWAGSNGGGIYNTLHSSSTLTNCIFRGNGDSSGINESSQIYGYNPDINYCCIQGWTGGLGGIGNHGDDPLFVDADGVDDIDGTEDDDLRLSHDSPCIDHGDNAAMPIGLETDLDGRARIIDGDCNDTDIVDMGAYEFNFAYMGDFDNDCEVDFGDFAILAQAWLTEAGDVQWNPACDIGIPNDSSINMPDLHVFVENWLAGVE
ncbi:MAG: lamin tail domain-containing protein [Planctomycetes bacterium]|nr:lamin tail domain-containing protein [Planctomycetota bacterium]